MPVATASGLVARELPPAEWHRLAGVEPYNVSGLPPSNGTWIMIVVEAEDQIVAHCAIHQQVHWDPWWMADDHQGRAGVMRALIREGAAALTTRGIDHAFCTITDADHYTADAAVKLGFTPAPGRLYLVDVDAVTRRF